MKYSLFLPINPQNYCPNFLFKLSDMYKHHCSENFNVSIMGPAGNNEIKAIEDILSRLDFEFNLYIINSPGFNYAYAVNFAVKEGVKKGILNPENLILMIDSWTAVSLHTLDIEIRKMDVDNSFVTVNVLRDSPLLEPFDFHSKRFMLSVSSRILKIQRDDNKIQKVIPIPILRLKNFVDLNGLEENLFTDYSRLMLMNKLKMSKELKQTESEKYALRLTTSPIFSKQQYDQDIKTYKELTENMPENFFVPNNLSEGTFGNPEKQFKLVINNDVSSWSGEKRIINIKPETKTQEPIQKKVIIPKKNEDLKIILLMDNDLPSIYEGTKHIKELYLKYKKPISIITNTFNITPIDRIKNFMVSTIFDFQRLDIKKFDITDLADVVYSSEKCSLIKKIDYKEIQILENNNNISPYYIIKDNIFTNQKFSNNFILVSCSSKPDLFKLADQKYWDVYKRIIENIAKTGIEIVSLKMKNEKEIIELRELETKFKNYNKKVCDDWDFYSYLTKKSRLTVINEFTDLVWISKLLHTTYSLISYTNIIDDTNNKNLSKSFYHLELDLFDKVINHLVETF